MSALATQNLSTNFAVPIKFAHIVLKARKYEQQVAFYRTLLGAHVVFQDENATALTYDDEHHRVLITRLPGLLPRMKTMAGVDHHAYTYETLSGLFQTYRRMKESGHTPVWCTHHGPTISIYYEDPDGNIVETQVDVFDTPEQVRQYMKAGDFATNPIGVECARCSPQ